MLQMEATGVEAELVGGGDRDHTQLLLERELLEVLDDSPDPFSLAAHRGEDGNPLQVVDEQREWLPVELQRHVADRVDVGVRPRPGDEHEAIGVESETT